MPSRPNPFSAGRWNNPQIGQALSQLVGVFQPPSMQDLAAGAKARATNEEAARQAELYDYAADPNFDANIFDRRNGVQRNYLPTQGFVARDMADATARRGDDLRLKGTLGSASIAADAVRYGADRRYDADIYGTRVDAFGNMFNPKAVGEDEILPGVTPEVAAAFSGLIGVDAPATAPVAGPRSPLSESEMLAAIIGQQDADTQRALLDPKTTNVIGPDGRPVVSSTVDAIGQQPYVNQGGRAGGKPVQWVDPATGQIGGTGVFDPNTQTFTWPNGAPPPSAAITELGKPEGGFGAGGVVPAPTAKNIGAGIEDRAFTEYAIGEVDDFLKFLDENPGKAGIAGRIKAFAQDASQTMVETMAALGPNATMQDIARVANDVAARGTGDSTYDPAYAALAAKQLQMAYLAARASRSDGRISVDELQRQMDLFRGGPLANTESIAAAARALRASLSRRSTYSNAVLGIDGAGRAAPAAPAAPGEYEYDPATGEMRRVN